MVDDSRLRRRTTRSDGRDQSRALRYTGAMNPTSSWPEWRTNLWHAAYCRWYDHRAASHRTRSALWGWVTDRIAR